MKAKEELNALKNEVETLNKKLAELTEEELEKATGGIGGIRIINGIIMECRCGAKIYDTNPIRVDENGYADIQCTQCGEWHRLQR